MYAAPSSYVRAYTSAVLFFCFFSPFSLAAEESYDPCCSIPHDVVTSCDDLPAGFDPHDWDLLEDLFGKPNGYYHCDNQNWHELDPELYLDNCGVGTINRRFKAYYQSSGWVALRRSIANRLSRSRPLMSMWSASARRRCKLRRAGGRGYPV